MWKKNEEAPQPATPSAAPLPRPQAPQKASVIGPSIRIKGDLTGKEDLVIQGQLEGEVRLQANNVTVGKEGRIRADIYGRTVHVEGEVKGHLFGEQEVVIRASGKVQGDIVSPRVVLENGSNFKGSIDMEPAAAKAPVQPAPAPSAAPAAARAVTPSPPPARGGGAQAGTGSSDVESTAPGGKSTVPAATPTAGNRHRA